MLSKPLTFTIFALTLCGAIPLGFGNQRVIAQESGNTEASTAAVDKATDAGGVSEPTVRPMAPLPDSLSQILKDCSPLNPDATVFLSAKKDRVLLRTEVACQDCMLEMFCCLEQSKEHESVLWARTRAYVVHAALLAVGAKPGSPVEFQPKFQPPSGQKIGIFVNWIDEDGKPQRADARSWMRHSVHRYFSHKLPAPPEGVKLPFLELRYDPYNNELLWFGPMTDEQKEQLLTKCSEAEYQKAIRKFHTSGKSRPMTAEFVFPGSFHYEADDDSGQKFYAAEGGFLICVANFPQATIDVREASSASDGGQTYEGWPEKVPARGTQVILELVPLPTKAKSTTKAVQP